MSEKITVSEFAYRYNTAKTRDDKSNVINSIICRAYVPFVEKAAVVQAVMGTAFDDQNGMKIPNAFCLHTSFYTMVLSLYTSLAVEKIDDDDKEAGLRAYDTLQANGIWSAIFEAIGSDYIELKAVRDMYLENMEMDRAPMVQIPKQVSRFGSLVGTAVKEQIDKLNPEDLNVIKTELMKVVK